MSQEQQCGRLPAHWVAVSLALNLALAAALFVSLHGCQRALKQPGFETKTHATNLVPVEPRAEVARATKPMAAFHWNAVESADYRQYIANLRAIECPEQVIRDIILADVSKLYGARMASLPGAPMARKFWQKTRPDAFDREGQKQFKALCDEKEAVLKELLGGDFSLKREFDILFTQADWKEGHLCFLSADKQAAARRILADFAKREEELQTLEAGDGKPRTKERRALLKLQLAELAKTLTPAELEEFSLRTSDTAQHLRFQLEDFQTTPDEFRAVFRIKEELEEAYADGRKEQERTQKEREAIKAVLGEQRFAEYERATDWAYQSAMQIARRDGLPADTGLKVFEVKKIAEQEARQIRADRTISSGERRTKLAAVKVETERALAEVLGDKGFQTYRREGGYWLSNLPLQNIR